jgi:hypothetical protein
MGGDHQCSYRNCIFVMIAATPHSALFGKFMDEFWVLWGFMIVDII